MSIDTEKILATIRRLESGSSAGDYKSDAQLKLWESTRGKQGSTASGAYQFLRSTWKNFGGYQDAKDAPASVQDKFAAAQVQSILKRFNGDIRYVPTAWYVGQAKASALGPDSNYIPPHNNLTVREYVTKWLNFYKVTTKPKQTSSPKTQA